MALIKVNNRGQSADFDEVQRGIQSKNLIMNGDFRVWQRPNSGTSVSLNTLGPDRWAVRGGSAMTLTSRTDYGTPKCLLAQSTGGTNVGIGQRIEAINCKRFAGQQCTISYYLRADFPAYHNLLIYYANAEDNHGGGQTNFVNTAKSYTSNVVTQITHTFTMPANAANGIEVILQWFDGGAGAFNLTAFIWDVQLELGDTATTYERLDISTQTQQCERYYQQVMLGNRLDVHRESGTSSVHFIPFKTEMRASPSLGLTRNSTVYGPVNTGAGQGGLDPANTSKYATSIYVYTSGTPAQVGVLCDIYAESEL